MAIILRNRLLLSSLLCNSESWYNGTEAELNLIESVDLQFFRRILNVPKSTPKEMFYLEFGCIPLRHIVRKRRLMFLHYILNENPNSMIYRFLMTQMKWRKKKDWIAQVLTDLKELKMDEDLEKIKQIKKSKFKNMVDKKIKQKVFEELINKKDSHSKVKDITYRIFQMQKYLTSCKVKITQEEAQAIFKLRTRMTDVKCNYKGKYESYECEICIKEEESQKHILICEKLNEKYEIKIEYEEIFHGSVKNKIEIARRFIKNLKNREKWRKDKNG